MHQKRFEIIKGIMQETAQQYIVLINILPCNHSLRKGIKAVGVLLPLEYISAGNWNKLFA